jgi:hypothetical protein
MINTNDIIAIIQRGSGELTKALWEIPPDQVTADFVMAYLERMASFAVYLPQGGAPNGNGSAPKAS